MMCEKTLKYKITSECIRKTTEVGSITKVMRSQRLGWYRTEGRAPITDLRSRCAWLKAAKTSGSLLSGTNTDSLKSEETNERFYHNF